MYISLNVAERIKLRAKEQGVSIKKLLAEVGLGFNTMSNMKTSMPKADNLAKIADYLNCSVDYLLGRTDIPEINKSIKSKEISEIEVIRALEKDVEDSSAMIRFNTAAFGGTKNTTAEIPLDELEKLDKEY